VCTVYHLIIILSVLFSFINTMQKQKVGFLMQVLAPGRRSPGYQAPFVLALDIGTSSTRALLFDANGTAVSHAISQHMYKLTTSGEGEASIDAHALLQEVALTIDETLREAGPLAEQIIAVATDTFWHSLVGIDASGEPVTPVITWEDTRPYESALQLRKQLDERTLHRRTGTRFHASYWPAKLHWLAQYQPQVFSQVTQWLSFGEYLHRQFLGRSVCSLSMASGTGMLVTQSCQWDQELMQFLRLRPEQMPALGDLGDSVQGLTPAYAARWPALNKIPWFPAIGDGATANIGSGAANLENWSLTIGTSSAIRVIVPPDHLVPPFGLWLYRIDRKRALLGGALSEGGNLMRWLKDTLKLTSLSEIEAQLKNTGPDEHGLTILPFLSGERSIGWHSEARMTISGITQDTTPAEMVRAGMEALAYRLDIIYKQLCQALCMEHTRPRLIGSGGALLASRLLQTIITDTLGATFYPSCVQEASARGGALLALEALGIIPDVAQIPFTLGEKVTPNEALGSIYRKAEQRQHNLYHLLLEE
jgi:gluconokinase